MVFWLFSRLLKSRGAFVVSMSNHTPFDKAFS